MLEKAAEELDRMIYKVKNATKGGLLPYNIYSGLRFGEYYILLNKKFINQGLKISTKDFSVLTIKGDISQSLLGDFRLSYIIESDDKNLNISYTHDEEFKESIYVTINNGLSSLTSSFKIVGEIIKIDKLNEAIDNLNLLHKKINELQHLFIIYLKHLDQRILKMILPDTIINYCGFEYRFIKYLKGKLYCMRGKESFALHIGDLHNIYDEDPNLRKRIEKN
jgi:hypothetical protein